MEIAYDAEMRMRGLLDEAVEDGLTIVDDMSVELRRELCGLFSRVNPNRFRDAYFDAGSAREAEIFGAGMCDVEESERLSSIGRSAGIRSALLMRELQPDLQRLLDDAIARWNQEADDYGTARWNEKAADYGNEIEKSRRSDADDINRR